MYTGFWITENIGNNKFCFQNNFCIDSQKKKQGSQIYVPEKIQGLLDDIGIGDKPVFREKNQQGDIVEYMGLQNFIEIRTLTENISLTNSKGYNCIIFDNHNHALFFWYQAYKKHLFKKGVKVIHIDQHTDMNKNKNTLANIEKISEQEVFNFTNYQCNVGNFIQPALQSGLIGSIELITTEYKLNNFDTNKDVLQQEDYILDIDLDFWHPNMSITNIEKTFNQTKKLIKYAKYITVATSPYFLDQSLAIALCKKILE